MGIIRRVFRGVVVLIILAASPAYAQRVYKLGVIPQYEPRKIADIWMPILRQLEAQSGLKFKLVGAKDNTEFAAALTRGDYDFAYMNPYQVVTTGLVQGYIPLVRDVGSTLRGIVVVRRDSELKTLRDLEGLEVAFPSPNSLAASLAIRAALGRQEGGKVRIKLLYVRTHSSVYLHVFLGQTPAGGGAMSTLNRQPPEIRNRLRVLFKTRDFPTHAMAAHPRVPERTRIVVTKALLELAQTRRGEELLAKASIVKLGMTRLQDYKMMREMGLGPYYIKE